MTRIFSMVGVAGLEPAASRSQTERSSQLSHTPKTKTFQKKRRVYSAKMC